MTFSSTSIYVWYEVPYFVILGLQLANHLTHLQFQYILILFNFFSSRFIIPFLRCSKTIKTARSATYQPENNNSNTTKIHFYIENTIKYWENRDFKRYSARNGDLGKFNQKKHQEKLYWKSYQFLIYIKNI